jgi:uncharacterized RDD family membrane protein YckC
VLQIRIEMEGRIEGVQSADAAGTPADSSHAYVYADVPNRLVGIFLDGAILSLLIFLGAVALSAVFGPVVRFDLDNYTASVDETLAVANAVVGLGIGGAYFVGSYTLLGASPGHRLLGMRLRDETAGGPVRLASAVVRWLLLAAPLGLAGVVTTIATGSADLLVNFALAAWYLVLLVTTARSPAKRGLHDRLARTLMVKSARRVASRPPDPEA